MKKLRVGVLGGTGMVGQRYIHLLQDHPWFEVVFIAASARSAGKTYAESVAGRWHMPADIPADVRDLLVQDINAVEAAAEQCDFVFSALGGSETKSTEENYARLLPMVSNASAHRWTEDVPMLVPEINHAHTAIIPAQQRSRGWKGFIAVKPNCSLQSYLTPLFALHREFTVEQVLLTTLQAVSGAGHPGVSSLDMIDNVVPYIGGEEEKSENEPLKILGRIEGDKIRAIDNIKISAHCTRVPVLDGHLATVSVKFKTKPSREEILQAWEEFRSLPQELELPFAPQHPIVYRPEPDRPQPRFDRDAEKGMAVVVGRLRPCQVLDYRFVGLSHNTIRGAAGGGILNAELLYKQGYITAR